jgi:hypothetical protein
VPRRTITCGGSSRRFSINCESAAAGTSRGGSTTAWGTTGDVPLALPRCLKGR